MTNQRQHNSMADQEHAAMHERVDRASWAALDVLYDWATASALLSDPDWYPPVVLEGLLREYGAENVETLVVTLGCILLDLGHSYVDAMAFSAPEWAEYCEPVVVAQERRMAAAN